jgi:L-alanine-DL-glutamate epimerase-like enolase superfamily enzyme
VAAADRARAASEAAAALAAGFGTVKLKVAIGDDAGRVAAVRAAGGPRLAIRLDANGGWGSEAEAWRSLEALAPAGIECCEEPVHGAEAIARLQSRTTMPLALDESAGDPAAGQHRCARAICLKVSRSGGIAGLLRDGRRARGLGYEVYLASTYDGPLGIAAALHAAAALTLDRPCGLATLSLFDRPDPLPPGGGRLAPPDGPGLGPELPGWYVD